MRKMKKVLALILALAMALSLTLVASAEESTGSVDISKEVITAGTWNDTEADGIVINSTNGGFNPIIIKDSQYTIKNAKISIISDADGSTTCDFSGLGAAIAAYGDDTVLWIKDSEVKVSGVANLALFADDGSDVIVENSAFHSDGGTLYAGYRNSPDQSTMVAPPWILGIMGTSRTTNLMGDNSSTTVIDSKVSSAQWAILSTDSGTNMQLNVVNTEMSLTGASYVLQNDSTFGTENGNVSNPYTKRAGYGTYTIGQADERFYGVTMNVGTYANILTGGYATYTALKAGEEVKLLDANDNVLTTYVPTADKVTTINSDTFGFMIHQNSGLPANILTIEEGTVVNSGYTTFLHKTGSSLVANVTSGSVLNPGNGILIQAMDNDDSTTGMDMATFSFYTTHKENAGWPTKGATAAGSESGVYNFDDVTLVGDIFNATGWAANDSGAQSPIAMTINLSGSTTLAGQISSTTAIHVTKAGSDAIKNAPAGAKASEAWLEHQNTEFPIGHYYDIGQVANKVASNTYNTIDVNITEDAVWTVTADGIVNNVSAASNAIVAAEGKTVTLSVAGTLTLDGTVVEIPEEGYTVEGVTYVKDTSVAAQPEGGEGGHGGMMPPMGGGDSEPAVWYTENDKLSIWVAEDGTVVKAGTAGATQYIVDRLMYGEADNLSSFSGGGTDLTGTTVGGDDYAFITALYVNGGKAVNTVGTLAVADEPAGDDAGDSSTTTPEKNPNESPKTGDTAMPVVMASVAVMALAAVLFVMKKKQA